VGLLAATVALLIWYELVVLPIRMEPSGWLTGPSLFAVSILVVLSALAFRGALAGRSLFGRFSFEDSFSS